MNTFTINGSAEGANALAKGIGNALQRVALADSYKNDAYLSTMGKVKSAEEARGLKMTNDFRENIGQVEQDHPSLTPHHKAALVAFKLLGQDADKFSKSADIEQAIGHREAVLQDPTKAQAVAQAHFATSGKAPFDNIGNSGHSLNQVTGEQVMTSPGLAKLFQGNAKTGSNAGKLTLSQQRGNVEIDAARQSVDGLTPEEVRRRTAKTTDTGRENPDYDPTLAKASTLAARRKIGSDASFDGRPQVKPEATDASVRFKSDAAMKGYRIGNLVSYKNKQGQTVQGYEVFDASGKAVGYYD